MTAEEYLKEESDKSVKIRGKWSVDTGNQMRCGQCENMVKKPRLIVSQECFS